MSVEPIQLIRTHSRLTASPPAQSQWHAVLSGHAAISESGELIGVDDFDAQAQATFESLQRTLRAGGSDLSKVVKVIIYLTDMSHFEKIVALDSSGSARPIPPIRSWR